MAITLPNLPYPSDALEPHISRATLEFHHGKHHRGYVDKVNALVKDTPLAGRSLEDIITAAAADPAKRALFNNAAQVWNHSFYWRSMTPKGGGAPGAALAARITADFGGQDRLVERFAEAATGQFGSGWAWLVLDKGALRVVATANADLPLIHGQTPLLVLDVWEHAYYLDYQNRRADYVARFLDQLVDWNFAERNLTAAEASGEKVNA